MRGSIAAPLVGYVVIGLLTFGYTYNRYDCNYEAMPKRCSVDRSGTAIMKGVFWPPYWAVIIAIEVTKP